MALLLVAFGAILIWFLIAPFLKPSPALEPDSIDPRVTCALCDELREESEVIERELGSGRFQYICGYCLSDMQAEFVHAHGPLPDRSADSQDLSGQ